MMQSLPEGKVHSAWGRLTLWVSQHQPITRLMILTAGLIIFLAFLPSYMRIVFWNGLQSHKFLASMLLVFSLLGISLVWSAGQRLDAWAFLLFNLRGQRPAWLDLVMKVLTQIGSGSVALAIALVLFLINDRMLSYELLLGTLTLWMIVELVKFLVHRSRPFIRLTQTRVVGNRARGRSFPSGHTSQVFFMATLITQHFHYSIWIVILLYTIAFLVGITRMYIGAHYPRDVLAGAILGSIWGLLGVILNPFT
jgi:membrane-associated phospholipid phosphatase